MNLFPFVKKIAFLVVLMPLFSLSNVYSSDSQVAYRGGGGEGMQREQGYSKEGLNRGGYSPYHNNYNDNYRHNDVNVNPYNYGNEGAAPVYVAPFQTDQNYENQLYNQNQPQ